MIRPNQLKNRCNDKCSTLSTAIRKLTRKVKRVRGVILKSDDFGLVVHKLILKHFKGIILRPTLILFRVLHNYNFIHHIQTPSSAAGDAPVPRAGNGTGTFIPLTLRSYLTFTLSLSLVRNINDYIQMSPIFIHGHRISSWTQFF